MSDTTTDPAPTQEEIDAARALLMRAQTIEQAAEAERQRQAAEAREAELAPVRALLAMDGYGAILTAAAQAMGQFVADDPVWTHLRAMTIGMGNLHNLSATPADAA